MFVLERFDALCRNEKIYYRFERGIVAGENSPWNVFSCNRHDLYLSSVSFVELWIPRFLSTFALFH